MTVPPLWPSALPLYPDVGPQLTGGPQEQRRLFEPQAGLPIARPSQTAEVVRYRVSLDGLTSAQMDTFRTFRVTTLKLGSLRFAWVHPQRRVLREVFMPGPPVERVLGGQHWGVSFEVSLVDVAPAWAAEVEIVDCALQLVTA